jgi:hypothetical protein
MKFLKFLKINEILNFEKRYELKVKCFQIIGLSLEKSRNRGLSLEHQKFPESLTLIKCTIGFSDSLNWIIVEILHLIIINNQHLNRKILKVSLNQKYFLFSEINFPIFSL